MDPKMQVMEKNFVSSTESFAEPAPVATGELSSLTPEERSKQCDEWKLKGNRAFENKDFKLAVEYYTEALKYKPTEHRVYSNRSFAFFHLGEYRRSCADALAVIKLVKNWPKGYYRLGLAFCGMKRYSNALLAFSYGLEIDQFKNQELLAAFESTKEALSKQTYESITWSQKAILGSTSLKQRCAHSAVLVGSRLFIIGGFSVGHFVEELYIVQLDTMTVSIPSVKGDVLPARASHSAVLFGNKIVIFGGISGATEYLNDVYSLNTDTYTWTNITCKNGSAVGGRSGHSAVIYGSDMIVFGGQNAAEVLSDLLLLDLKKREWFKPKTTGKTPEARNSHASALVGSTMYIFGGCFSATVYFNDLHALDLDTMTWTEISVTGVPPAPRMGHAAALVKDHIYVFGGLNSNHEYTAEMWIYSPTTKKWHKPEYIGDSPQPRIAHSLTLYGTKLLMFGGDGGKGLLEDLYFGETDVELQQLHWQIQEQANSAQAETTKRKALEEQLRQEREKNKS